MYALVTSLPKREDPSAGHTVIFKEALKGGGSVLCRQGRALLLEQFTPSQAHVRGSSGHHLSQPPVKAGSDTSQRRVLKALASWVL